MELLVLALVVIIFIIWVLTKLLASPTVKDDPVPRRSYENEWKKHVHAVDRGGKPVTLQSTRASQKPTIEPFIENIVVPDGVVDLRELDSRRVRVVGLGHYVDYAERISAWSFVLVRARSNRYDSNAIEVCLLSGRHVGFVSAKLAASYAPMLDLLGKRFLVSGVGSSGTTSSRLWVDLPRTPALRSMTEKLG